MSWEGKTMRSGTSCFDRAFSRSLLRRFWPLWLVWLALLLLVGVGAPLSVLPESYADDAGYLRELTRALLIGGVTLGQLAMAASPLVAMAMLGYLYHPKSCAMVCALPLRRETAYLTAVLTGLVPMLVCDALTCGLLALRYGALLPGAAFAQWLGAVGLANLGFYGLACFCGALTGNAVVLPLVYAVLGFTAALAEAAVMTVLGLLVYGFAGGASRLFWLSPLPAALERLQVSGGYTLPAEAGVSAEALPLSRLRIEGLGYLGGVCAAGILLLLPGVLLIRRRQMEVAGDIVALPGLRPLFRVCMALGMGLVLAAGAGDGFLADVLGGRALACAVFAVLILGAALGWFLAEMLIQKTLRVFRRGWKGLGLCCLCLLLPFVLAELDVTGYEKRVPDPAAVECLELDVFNGRLSDPVSVAAYCDFHRALIAHKAANDTRRAPQSTHVTLCYRLADGGTLTRSYRIPDTAAGRADPASDLAAYERLLNLPEAILWRAGASREVSAATIRYAGVDVNQPRADRGYVSGTCPLTPEQAARLYAEGILPDAREGTIARRLLWDDGEGRGRQTNLVINLDLVSEREVTEITAWGYRTTVYDPTAHLSLNVLADSSHTLAWLKENLGLEPQTWRPSAQ